MKRIFIILIFVVALILLTKISNLVSVDDNLTMDGYILIKNSTTYLITDDNFNVEEADTLPMQGLLFKYKGIYTLNIDPAIENGEKVRVWYSAPILESHPARIKVLKMEKI